MTKRFAGRASWSMILLSTLASILVGSASTEAQKPAPEVRVTQPISDSNLVRLYGNTPLFTLNASDGGTEADDFQVSHVQLLLKRSTAQENSLESFLSAQQQRDSAEYHHWLAPQAFGSTYGVADADLEKVTDWLTQHGFTIDNVSNGRTVVTISGTQAQLRSAFHTEIHHYDLNGAIYYANASDPSVPAALAGVVSGFASLSNFGPQPQHTQPHLASRVGGAWQTGESLSPFSPKSESDATKQQGGAAPQFVGQISGINYNLMAPGDFATIYNVRPLWNQNIKGSGQSIAIVAQSDVNPADVDAFRAAFGLPATKLSKIYLGPNPGYTRDGVEGEAALDVEWSGATAPNAMIDLIVSAQTNVGGGVTVAAQYAVDNNIAPILSVSWGACELGLGAAGNQFFHDMWQQAAAEGITVLVASGDAAAASCNQNQNYATYGEQVSGFASTPYNTAVGGTDFYSNHGHAAQYWNSTNNADGSSALGYIPESPWNESCASGLVLGVAQTQGFSGDLTSEALCNDTRAARLLRTVGGGGGSSLCTISDQAHPSTCTGGYARPDWQIAMPGLPQNGARAVPDISFFSGSGLWGTALIFCQSDLTPDGTCNYMNGDLDYLLAGGTSFATPAFAGVVALMMQHAGGPLGNINYSLYQLGAAQYGSKAAAVFHDVAIDNNATPCYKGTTAALPNIPCTVANSSRNYGVLPGFASTAGFDLATGLGSADVSALVSAWKTLLSGEIGSKTTLAVSGPASVVYGTNVQSQIQVSAASGSAVPTGAVALFDQDTTNGTPLATAQLTNAAAQVTENMLPVGSHVLYARYTGNGTFAGSSSNTVPMTVTQAATTLTFSSGLGSVSSSASFALKILVKSTTTAASPTGSIVVKDITNGTTLATVSLAATNDPVTGNAEGYVTVVLPGRTLASGLNTLSASYNGDTNYTGSGNTATITYTPALTLALPATSLTLAPGSTTGNSMTVVVTPAPGSTLNPASLLFSCPGNLPSGLTCKFSAPTVGANGSVSSTLTVVLSTPLAMLEPPSTGWLSAGLTTSFAGLAFLWLPSRRRSSKWLLGLMCASIAAGIIGCGGSPKAATANVAATQTQITTSSTTPAIGSSLTLSATVASVNGNGAPTGSVTFLDGANILGTSLLSSGSATFNTTALSIGTHSITASYSGDSTFNGSNSSLTNIDVTSTSAVSVMVQDAAGNTSQQTLSVIVQ